MNNHSSQKHPVNDPFASKSNHTSIESLPQLDQLDQKDDSQTTSQVRLMLQPMRNEDTIPARETASFSHSKSAPACSLPTTKEFRKRPDRRNETLPTTRSKSVPDITVTRPSMPPYESFPVMDSSSQGRGDDNPLTSQSSHGKARRDSRGRRRPDTARSDQPHMGYGRSESLGSRLKSAVKDIFGKKPKYDAQYDIIEDRHWTDY